MRRYTPSEIARCKEVAELQAAFDERAAVHALLTDEGVPPGELRWRIAYVLAQVRAERDPWAQAPTPIEAPVRREESTHAKAR